MQIKSLECIGHPGYAVMENGVVFRIGNLSPLKPDINHSGYARVTLSTNGETKRLFVHRIVATAFLENPEDKPCVNHIDNNPFNNSLGNLEWVTHQENSQHMVDQGRESKKLTRGEIEFIQRSPLGSTILARMFDTTKSNVLYHKHKFVKEE